MENNWINQDWEMEAQKDEIYSLERRMEEEQNFHPSTIIKIIIKKKKKNDKVVQSTSKL